MTLREQYNKLENDIQAEYQRLINIGDYSFIETTIKEYFDSNADEVLNIINNEDILEAEQQFSMLECFEQIYYTTNKGNERMCYLLGVEKENGLYVFDDENFDTMFLSFESLSNTFDKITVIETIENS